MGAPYFGHFLKKYHANSETTVAHAIEFNNKPTQMLSGHPKQDVIGINIAHAIFHVFDSGFGLTTSVLAINQVESSN